MMTSPLLAAEDQPNLINTEAAQRFQIDYDGKYFEINHDFEKLRHIILHLMKTVGKAATYCEIKEHGKIDPDSSPLINEVTPDLLIHALQLANYFNIDLGSKYNERIEAITQRASPKQQIYPPAHSP